MEDVRISLKTTKDQLSQVEFAIANGQTGEDICEARDQLKEVVTLLEESLLAYEKSRLLAMLDDDNDDPPIPSTSETVTNPAVESQVEEAETTTQADPQASKFPCPNADADNLVFLESISDVDEVSGLKCQAPFHTEWSGTQYHNAMIVGLSSSPPPTHDDELPSVDVLFLNPFIEKMKPCPYYLEGDCKFTEETCKFSHGYCVGINQLHMYKERNYNEFKAGQSCLAKLPSGIWSKATIASVEKGINCTVKFVEQNLTAELSIDEVLPNSSNHITNISSDDEEDVKAIGDTSYSATYGKGATGDESSVPLGAWEEHTRGIGSKIMKRFGYKEGEGLGRNGQGRVVPVPIVVLPPGKSLDYCAEKKKKKEKAGKKKEQRAASTGASVAAAAAGGNVFKFLNKTLGGGGSSSHHRRGSDAAGKSSMRVSKSSSFKLKGSKQQDLEMSQKLVRNQSMITAKKDAIKKLNIQIQRNTLTNPAVAERFRGKLRQISSELKDLESSNATLETQRNMKKDFKSMVKF